MRNHGTVQSPTAALLQLLPIAYQGYVLLFFTGIAELVELFCLLVRPDFLIALSLDRARVFSNTVIIIFQVACGKSSRAPQSTIDVRTNAGQYLLPHSALAIPGSSRAIARPILSFEKSSERPGGPSARVLSPGARLVRKHPFQDALGA
jgi:hypothetical protein